MVRNKNNKNESFNFREINSSNDLAMNLQSTVNLDNIDDESFKEKLGAVSLKSLIRNAKERRPGSMGYAEAIILEYNGKRKNPHTRLAMNKLYAKDNLYMEDEYDYEEETEEELGENYED